MSIAKLPLKPHRWMALTVTLTALLIQPLMTADGRTVTPPTLKQRAGTFLEGMQPPARWVGAGPEGPKQDFWQAVPMRGAASPLAVNAANACGTFIPLPGQITGVVSAADSGMPLANVQVRLYEESATYLYDYIRSDITDDQGAYQLGNIPPGSYRVFFKPSTSQGVASPYAFQWYNNQQGQSNGTIVAVGNGTVPNVNAALNQGAQVTGTVLAGDSGLPLQSVDMDVFDRFGNYLAWVETDELGRYTTFGLPPGEYRLRADARYGDLAAKQYLYKYYPDSLEYNAAIPLTITAPGLISNINYTLNRGALITGQVSAADTAAPLPGGTTYADKITEPYYYDFATIDSQGFYTLSVPSGGYVVSAYPSVSPYVFEYYENQSLYDTATTVNVVAPNVRPNINLALDRGATIAGRLTDQITGEGLSSAYVYFYRDSATSTSNWSAYAYTDASGYYTSTGLTSGGYKVRFERFDYLDAFYSDQFDLGSASLVTVTAPTLTSNIDEALASCVSLSSRVMLPLMLR